MKNSKRTINSGAERYTKKSERFFFYFESAPCTVYINDEAAKNAQWNTTIAAQKYGLHISNMLIYSLMVSFKM